MAIERPLPWHDTPLCREKRGGEVCGLHMESDDDHLIRCTGCGTTRVGSKRERAQCQRSEMAWSLVEAGRVWPDRACSGCGSVLFLDRQRLCAPCVQADNRERQGFLDIGR